MTTATFTYKAKRTTIYGTVTLKNDGKVSVSMPYSNKYNTSAAERYQAKQLAMAIVAADFKHEAVNSLTIANTNGLVARLKAETVELLEGYIERTKKFAKQSYDWALSHASFTNVMYGEKYGLVERKEPIRMHDGRIVTHKLSQLAEKTRTQVVVILAYTAEQYEARQVKMATQHYNDSIEKLALKLNRKGIKDDTEMTMKSTSVGINLETIIHHEGTITTARTIFAAEDSVLVSPHYRYLVK